MQAGASSEEAGGSTDLEGAFVALPLHEGDDLSWSVGTRHCAVGMGHCWQSVTLITHAWQRQTSAPFANVLASFCPVSKYACATDLRISTLPCPLAHDETRHEILVLEVLSAVLNEI